MEETQLHPIRSESDSTANGPNPLEDEVNSNTICYITQLTFPC